MYMNILVNQIIKQDLSSDDIHAIAPNTKIMLYEDLQQCKDIFDAIGETNVMVLLFPIKSNHDGYWVTVIYHPNMKLIEHFDSYGLNPIEEMGYTK